MRACNVEETRDALGLALEPERPGHSEGLGEALGKGHVDGTPFARR